MPIDTVASLVRALREHRLLDPEQLAELGRPQFLARFPDLRSLARHFVQQNWLTPFQVNQLVKGQGASLVLGSYVLLERLGEGGMGAVFKARHRNLGRIVALKLIRKEYLDNPVAVRRFRREIKAAAQLVHPHIVTAFDADEAAGTHYFVMEFVAGIDLGRLVQEQGPLPPATACGYIRHAALGLQHAHECGLVHRDIKPANLLLTGARTAVVKVLDLGLARAAGEEINSQSGDVTQDGKVVGTPDFMAPEQARNSHAIDIRADLYSMGCTLYFLLTGQVPYPGGTAIDKMLRHQSEAPVPLEQLRPGVPAAVAAVVRRLMAREPADRFQTPAELVAALEACAHGDGPLPATEDFAAASAPKPPRAIEPSPTREAARVRLQTRQRRTRRRLVLATVTGVASLGSVALLIALIVASLPRSGRPGPDAHGEGSSANRLPSPLDALEAGQVPAAERVAGQPPELVAVLGEHHGRHWGPARCVAVSPDGKVLASGGQDHAVRLWDAETLQERGVFKGHTAPVTDVTFSLDGKTLASAGDDRSVRLWDVATGRELFAFLNQGNPVAGLTFARDGQTLAAVSWAAQGNQAVGVVNLWDVAAGKAKGAVRGPAGASLLALSPDGRLAAGAGLDPAPDRTGTVVRVWNATTGQERTALDLPAGTASLLAFSPDGSKLAVAGSERVGLRYSGKVRIWNLRTNDEPTELPDQASPIGAVAFAPGGQALVLGRADGHIRFYDMRSGEEQAELVAHRGPVTALAFAADGRGVASAGGDGGVRFWRLPLRGTPEPVPLAAYPVVAICPAPDGRSLAVGHRPRGGLLPSPFFQVQVWDLTAPRPPLALPATLDITGLAYSPDSRMLAATGWLRQELRTRSFLKLWDPFSGQERWSSPETALQFQSLAVAPDGQSVATGTPGGGVVVWDLQLRRERTRFGPFGKPGASIRFALDGRTALVRDPDGGLKMWELDPPRQRFALPPAPGITALTMSPDGDLLATAGSDERGPYRLRVWDTTSGEERASLATPIGPITDLALSPDGQRLAAASQEGRVLLWQPFQPGPPRRLDLPGPVFSVAFAPDGRHLFTGNGNGTVYVLRLNR